MSQVFSLPTQSPSHGRVPLASWLPARYSSRYYLITFLTICMIYSAAVPASTSAQQIIAIGMKLELLQNYLKSKTTQKIEDGDNAAAKMLLQRAHNKAQQASTSYSNGDMHLSAEQTDEGLKIYSETLAAHRNKNSANSLLIKQNKSTREEINSYLLAYNEALKTKGPSAEGILNSGKFDELIAAGDRKEKSGDPAAAQRALKQAYNMIVMALTRIKENETVVYSLDFRTPADEYRYELNRYESYKMLVLQKSEDPSVNESSLKLAGSFKLKSTETFKVAQRQAALGDYETAIKSLEDANRGLIRTLRVMGLYVPG